MTDHDKRWLSVGILLFLAGLGLGIFIADMGSSHKVCQQLGYLTGTYHADRTLVCLIAREQEKWVAPRRDRP
jgi:hypothetical protein